MFKNKSRIVSPKTKMLYVLLNLNNLPAKKRPETVIITVIIVKEYSCQALLFSKPLKPSDGWYLSMAVARELSIFNTVDKTLYIDKRTTAKFKKRIGLFCKYFFNSIGPAILLKLNFKN